MYFRKLSKFYVLFCFFFSLCLIFPKTLSAQESEIEYISKILDKADDVHVENGIAYVANGDLVAIDVKNPEAPTEVGRYSLDTCYFAAIDIEGDYAYLGQVGVFCYIDGLRVRDSIHVVNISDPSSLYEIGWKNITGIGGAIEVRENTKIAYVAFAQGGLRILDVTDPTNPQLIAEYESEACFYDLEYKDGRLYVATDYGLWVLNVEDPSNPTLVSENRIDYFLALSIKDNYLYAVTGKALRIADISDPLNIQFIGEVNLHELGYSELTRDVAVSGNYAVVANQEAINIVDVSDPTTPVEVANYHYDGGKAHRVFISGKYVYIADILNGLYIFRYEDLPNEEQTVEPFLDLPWDYESKGLSFTEASLAINSYFDHEYPLLSSGMGEPGEVVWYKGFPQKDLPYSSHDGYDYGRLAKAYLGEPMLAAASGIATYGTTCKPACGNAIYIDHGNGYQTRYYHMLWDGLIVNTPGNSVEVTQGQQIGKIGSEGRSTGPHIHFMVVHDKNGDGNFDDNIPDGVVDPYGWQGDDPDPWPNYDFYYTNENRSGSISTYLWVNKTESENSRLSSEGRSYLVNKFSIFFPEAFADEDVIVSMDSASVVAPSNNLRNIGAAIVISIKNLLGVELNEFDNDFTITKDLTSYDLSAVNESTLSFYSSEDGQTWQIEGSVYDPVTQILSTNVNHLTYFAIFAERKDILAPTTTVILSGEEGQEGWYRSGVGVVLEAQDNEGGLGIYYTMYRLDDGDWEIYSEPIYVVDEGDHKVEFYSSDNDENIEDLKSVAFHIDTTAPEMKIVFAKDIWSSNILGVDDGGEVSVEIHKLWGNRKAYELTDLAGNKTTIDAFASNWGKADNIWLKSITYNNGEEISFPGNYYYSNYFVNWWSKKIISYVQTWIYSVEEGYNGVGIRYSANEDITHQITKESNQVNEFEFSGIKILSVYSDSGNLKYIVE